MTYIGTHEDDSRYTTGGFEVSPEVGNQANILWKKLSQRGDNHDIVMIKFGQEKADIKVLREKLEALKLNGDEEEIKTFKKKLDDIIADFNDGIEKRLEIAQSKDHEIARKNFTAFMDAVWREDKSVEGDEL